MLFRGLIRWCKCGAVKTKEKEQIIDIQLLALFFRDPVGIEYPCRLAPAILQKLKRSSENLKASFHFHYSF